MILPSISRHFSLGTYLLISRKPNIKIGCAIGSFTGVVIAIAIASALRLKGFLVDGDIKNQLQVVVENNGFVEKTKAKLYCRDMAPD